MLCGYVRVSTSEQNLDVQIAQMNEAGCDKIFAEKKSGRSVNGRAELESMMSFVREGDVIVVARLDRLARSMKDFCDLFKRMQEKGVGFKCLLQPIDTTSAHGLMTAQILMAVAEFEWTIRRDRQREGIDAAKDNGVYAKAMADRIKERDRLDIKIVENQNRFPGIGASELARISKCSRARIYLAPGFVSPGEEPKHLRCARLGIPYEPDKTPSLESAELQEIVEVQEKPKRLWTRLVDNARANKSKRATPNV